MKHIKEKFELTEDDVKKAINYYVRQLYGRPDDKYETVLSVTREVREPPEGAPVGGMADYSVQVVTAVAVKL